MEILPSGSTGLLVELDDLEQVLALYAALRESRPDGVVDLVPAARTVLVVIDPEVTTLAAVGEAVRDTEPRSYLDGAAEEAVEIPVVYDGEDLADVAAAMGCDEAEVVRLHTEEEWTVAFCGFAPGFGYLIGTRSEWNTSRRDSPRTKVPAGSVALAGEFSAVYPRASPGGWQLIGRTEHPVFDLDRDPPALLRPGRPVRFVDAGGTPGRRRGSTRRTEAPSEETALEVLSTGVLTTVQDRGRIGQAALGIGRSGAADRGAAALANRLVGNEADAAVLEVTMGGLELRARRTLTMAATGARCPGVPHHAPFTLRPGERIDLGFPVSGVRTYLAVRGGITVAPVLGSRSTDVLSGLGPQALDDGDELPVGTCEQAMPGVDVAPVAEPPVGEVRLVVHEGPRRDWFTDGAWATLCTEQHLVTADSNRIGLRLESSSLERAHQGELRSEGMMRGAIQVTPEGGLVLFLADHPVTGGYPVIGYVEDRDVDRCAQLQPGQPVRFDPAKSSGS